MPEIRWAFLGSGEFAVPALEHLSRSGVAPRLVISQPDRPAGRGRSSGRGRKPAPPPVALAAGRLGLPLFQPDRIGAPGSIERLRAAQTDFLVVADYGQILPPPVLEIPRCAAVNLHGSLLPRWRGAAPAARAILAGDLATGVTTIRMDAGVDTGEILLQEETPILPSDTAGELEARLARMGALLVERTLRGLASGTLRGGAQPSAGATHAPRLSMEEARLDWGRDEAELERRVRAYHPWPVAWTLLQGERLKIWRARSFGTDRRAAAGAADAPDAGAAGSPGTLVRAEPDRLLVLCGRGSLELVQIQFPGGKPLSVPDALNGRKIRPGQRLE